MKAIQALTILSNVKLPAKGHAQKWSKLIAAQLDELHRQERMTPRRAIAIGLMLHTVKASLKHGEFEPWKAQMLGFLTFGTPGWARVKANIYMRLATAFVQVRELTAPDLAALPAGGGLLNLDSPRGAAAKLVQHIDEFCGEMSLPELMAAHVKSKSSGGGGGGDGGSQAATLATEWLLGLRQNYLTPERLKLYPRDHLKDVEQQTASFLSEYRQLLADLGVKD